MDAGITEGFQEWAASVMYSGWFYAAISALFVFFCVTLVFGLVWLFRRNGEQADASTTRAAAEPAFDYSALAGIVGKPNGRPRKILLAAASPLDLPVTIPVNMAIQLAASRTCLLIDLDIKRDAVAHVFEIASDARTGPPGPVSTSIENLHIWPAHYFSQRRQMDLKTVLTAAGQKYDVILLNAPTLVTHPDRGRIIRCAESAVAFVKDKKAGATLLGLLEKGSCKTLKTLCPRGKIVC